MCLLYTSLIMLLFATILSIFKEVDCFTDQLQADGYVYNDIRDWWERQWTTNQGKESIIEAYKQDDQGWKSIMVGYGDRVFYEERVKGST